MHERGPRAPDEQLLVGLEALADVEGELRPVAVDGDRAAVRADDAGDGLEGDEVLADGDRGDAEPGDEVRDPGTALLLDDAGDLVLPLPGEHVHGRGVGRTRHGRSFPPADALAGLRNRQGVDEVAAQ